MPTLTAWRFSTVHGADAAEYTVMDLQRRGMIVVHDAAVVTWEEGQRRPKTREVDSAKGKGAVHGTFWGLLFGIIFFVPLLGAAVGAAAGAWRGSLRDVGISDKFIDDVRESVVPGTSALFLLTSDAVIDEVVQAFAGHEHDLISTSMTADEEKALLDVFSAEGS